jgi:riboflavin synthase
MFTGIIEGLGTVECLALSGESGRLCVDVGPLAEGLRLGDSVAVNGACLTAVRIAAPAVEFDVSAETLRVTTLGALTRGAQVNLERALRVGDRLGGHFVLGHVDALGTVSQLRRAPGQVLLEVTAAPEIIGQMIPKGSVALDGISLTLAALRADRFSVAVIPHTLDSTTLRTRSPGDKVNLELDVIGKYVQRLLERSAAPQQGGKLSSQFLAEHGFA